MRGWLLLLAAIAVEVVATSFLPATEGFTRVSVTVPVLLGYAAALFLLSRTLRFIPLSVTYALWSGLGTAAVAVVGVLALGEALTWTKALGTGLVIAGVVVLELSGERQAAGTVPAGSAPVD